MDDRSGGWTERWIGSLKSECFDRFWVFGLDHLDHITSEFASYYNYSSHCLIRRIA